MPVLGDYTFYRCPKCGEDNPLSAAFCLFCGCAKNAAPSASPEELEPLSGPTWKMAPFAAPLWEKLRQKRAHNATMAHLRAAINCRRMLRQNGGFQFKTLGTLPFMPRDYQLQAVRQVLGSMGGNAILADEVGLGKTVEAGLILNELLARKMVKKTLIIVPAALMEQWQNELAEKFGLAAEIIHDVPEHWPDIAIISHQRVRGAPYNTLAASQALDMVIVDEAQILRSSNTILYRFMYSLPRRYTLLLTATPLQNNLYELYSLIQLVQPGHFRSRRFFKRRFIDENHSVRNADLLQDSCRRVMVRNRRISTLVPIPSRQVETVTVKLSAAEERFYQFILELARLLYRTEVLADRFGGDTFERSRWLLILLVLLKESTSSPAAILATMENSLLKRIKDDGQLALARRIMEQGASLGLSAKMKALLKLLSSWDPADKVIIYTEYHATLTKLEQILTMAGYKFVTFSGAQTERVRREQLAAFKADVPIMISTEVGGQGLNLQFCHRIINYDLPWNPMRVEQRIGRVHRLGQQNIVEIFNIVSEGTFESYLLALLWAKIGLFTKVVGEIDSILSYVKNEATIEGRIGQAILESVEDEELLKRFKELAKEIEEAQLLFDHDRQMTATILNFSAGEQHE